MRPPFVASVPILVLCLAGARGECQTAPRKTGPAVFGGTATRADEPGGLDLSTELFTAYDDDVLRGQQGGGGASNRPRPASSAEGLYSGFGIGLLYARPGDRASFRSWANSSLTYYPVLRDLTTRNHDVGLDFSTPLGRQFHLDGSSYAVFSPRYSMQLFPVPLRLDRGGYDGAGPPAPDVVDDFTIVERKSFRYGARVGLSLLSTAHSRVNVTYGFTKTMTPSGDRTADFEVQNAGIGFTRRLTQYTSLRTGYAFREGTYAATGPAIDANAQPRCWHRLPEAALPESQNLRALQHRIGYRGAGIGSP